MTALHERVAFVAGASRGAGTESPAGLRMPVRKLLPPAALSRKPNSASWLNMIEIEFSALSRQCLSRRIATKEELIREVLVVVKEGEEKAIKINWQFSIASARSKLNRHDQQVNAENAQL